MHSSHRLGSRLVGNNATRWILPVLLVVPLTGCASQLEKRFQAHIDFLASDALTGRGVGTPGIEASAEYIAEQFESLGLEPAGDDGTYFSTFSMTLERKLTDKSRLAYSGDTNPRVLREDFVPFGFSSNDEFNGGIMFCGYGAVVPDKEWDDYDGLDLEGNVAMILRAEPDSWADENGFPTKHAMLQNKVYNAKDRGAVAVLFVNREPAEGDSDRLMPFRTHGANAYGIPAFHITRAMADEMLAGSGMDSISKLQRRLDEGSFASGWLAHKTMSGYAGFEKVSAPTRNVQAMLKGAGPHADEVVVIGAHYDHLGIAKPMMRRFKAGKIVADSQKPQIHNGADDNASGVSGLIEIARMFSEGTRPDRSILFLAFTAEESGLHGSMHYVESPIIEMDKTAAMLNMDMIGRMPPFANSVQVFGSESGEGLPELLQREGKRTGVKVLPTGDDGGRSDHAPFIRKQVPGMHFFTGQHSDYHKPTDDSHKINAKGGADVTTLVYRVADKIANLQDLPKFRKAKRRTPKDKGDGPLPSYRVVMGLAPGYGDDGVFGMKVEAVSPEGPADEAGMKPGDRIISIGGKKVANVYDYMASTRNNKAGETVPVIVTRGGKEITLQVKLAPAR